MSRATLKAIQAAAGNAGGATYVDDVFSTYLYTGNSTSRTITNGIDLAGEGGLVWIKWRSGSNAVGHLLYTTDLGAGNYLSSNSTANLNTGNATQLNAFNSDGFSLGISTEVNYAGDDYASWTFRKQPGFFDVVTYTGDGVAGREIAHNLGSAPGMMIVKSTSDASGWAVYHRSLGATEAIRLDSTGASFTASNYWNDTEPTDSVFTLGTAQNANGIGFVAYLFAHDAQDFGTGSDESIIKCGSFTTDVNGEASVDLGWEPQWVLAKVTNNTTQWLLVDTMRGFYANGPSAPDRALFANSANAESNNFFGDITSTGIEILSQTANQNFIYVAIRRPQKPAEEFAATDLFDLGTRNGVNDNPIDITGVNFPVDAALITSTNQQEDRAIGARLTGKHALFTNTTGSQSTRFGDPGWDHQDGVSVLGDLNKNTYSYIDYFFRRAPGFFDVVTYAGNNSARSIDHNLGVAPEWLVIKNRGLGSNWPVYYSGAVAGVYPLLNRGDLAAGARGYTITASDTHFTLNNGDGAVNSSGYNYIAYLFATVPGISKVGSYTGTAANVDVNCGFTSGARFVLVKRTDSAGDWYVWDSVRGITAGNDPYLLLSSNQPQTTGTDYIDPLSSGFTITSSAPAALNASGGTYIFLAIA
jgi:hypothetical protein